MADNVAITAGSGTDVATDQVTGTGEHVQLFKLAIAADGSRVLIPADATNGLLVNVSQVQGQVQIGDGTQSVAVDASQSDAEANSVNSLHTSSRLYVYNGTTWDRVRGTIADGLLVDVSRITAPLPAGTNMIGKIDLSDGTNDAVIDISASDAESATSASLVTNARLKVFNGTTWDRQRGSVSTNKTVQQTAAQTGSAIWTPAAGKAVVITSLQIQSYGTTAGTSVVWFGGAADTTYTRGTDFPIFDGEFAPSATNKPGVYITFPTPVRGTADFVLRLTTTNAQSITVSVWGYEI